MKGVDYVFHAAALKQVPSCEFYPMEAIRTNMLGAENVLNAAIAQRRREADRAVDRQGGLSDQRHGDVQGADGEADGGQGAVHQAGRHDAVRHPLRQRDGLARLGDSAVHRADQGRQAADDHRSRNDPVPDVDRRRGRSRAVSPTSKASRATFSCRRRRPRRSRRWRGR